MYKLVQFNGHVDFFYINRVRIKNTLRTVIRFKEKTILNMQKIIIIIINETQKN